jgi:predicted extracellular nuclease
MNKWFIFIGLSLFLFTSCNLGKTYTVAFYNTENLFDTISSGTKFDGEFSPDSSKNWNTAKYKKKISDLAHVISSINGKKNPVMMGICEVENDLVLKDLIADQQLKKANYKIVWEDSPDLRGIDCALLYNPDKFRLESYQMLPVINPDDPKFATRDIVYVKGYLGKELFHVFVNHWPSRRGGEEISNEKRNLAATVLRNKIDEIFKSDSFANIIIMGDLNDEPSNPSIAETLKALPNTKLPGTTDLVNLMWDENERGEGSYCYKNKWDMIDNLIVSGNLITKKHGIKTTLNNGFIFHKPFMEFVNDKGQMSPNRTYGKNYFGGVSDHFPVYLILK